MNKKATDVIDGFLNLADLLREIKETVPKLEDIPGQIKNLEAHKKQLTDEVDSLNRTRDEIRGFVEAEKAKEIAEINSKLRSVSEKESLLDSERTQIKNELGRIETRDKELTDMIGSYEKATKEAQESKSRFDAKLKEMGELAVR